MKVLPKEMAASTTAKWARTNSFRASVPDPASGRERTAAKAIGGPKVVWPDCRSRGATPYGRGMGNGPPLPPLPPDPDPLPDPLPPEPDPDPDPEPDPPEPEPDPDPPPEPPLGLGRVIEGAEGCVVVVVEVDEEVVDDELEVVVDESLTVVGPAR